MSAPDFTLRVNFSHEDKAAKGLRSLREQQAKTQEPVYFTAREMADLHPRLLLLGGRGSGKSVLARQLAEERGAVLIEIVDETSLPSIPPQGDLILDGIDRLGRDGEVRLARFLDQIGSRPAIVLGDDATVRGWRLPGGFTVHTVLPLSLPERRAHLAEIGLSTTAPLSPVAANPALFALSLTVDGTAETAEDLADVVLARHPDRASEAFARIAENRSVDRVVDDLLAAAHLAVMAEEDAAALLLADPDRWSGSFESLLRRAPQKRDRLAPLVTRDASDAALKAALLVYDPAAPDSAIAEKLLGLIEQGRLSVFHRDRAARLLAMGGGDPRALDALCNVPGGRVVMGSATHPNSEPVHTVTVAPFRIGRYPVSNGDYQRFVSATGRRWISPEAGVAERSNAPATDLTWHDARAYCAWLTDEWRHAGRIGADETVRLPTEPEWERAARGDQSDGGDGIVYPWGSGWNPEATNSEETGFNAPCAVGLFPAGVSPYGCYDMAGQVWEWTTTLWGSDMATPAYRYPYADDGRENADAPPEIRRVLRGGCFSSTSAKACCTYRGSLEPNGFWRGNGFRIVVA